MKRIGIICAMEAEAQYLKNKIANKEKILFGQYQVILGSISNKEVALIVCGIGKVMAASATSLLISKMAIDYIIHYGLCGASSGYQVGDLVFALSAYQGDFDLTAFAYPPCYHPGLKSHLVDCDKRLIAEAETLANRLGLSYHQGIVCSKDHFIGKENISDLIIAVNDFNAHFFDMEGAAVATCCHLLKTRCLVVRAISDIIGQDVSSYNQNETPVSNQVASFIYQLLINA